MTFSFQISKLDSYLGLGLSIVLAVIDALNITTFSPVQPWHSLILYGAPAIAAFGIAPITSAKLDTLLHLSNQMVIGLTALVGTAVAAVQTFGWPQNTVGIITGVLVLIGGVLFGTVVDVPTPVPAPAPVSAGRHK
jgi:hypothetical protein